MAYPARLLKVILGGHMPGGEIWSVSFGVDTSLAPGEVDIDNTLGELNKDASAGGGFFTAFTTMNPATVTLETWRGYLYDGTGPAISQGEIPTDWTQSGVTLLHPNQVCAVASLRTNHPGRSARGRMYLPALGVSMGANGQAANTGLASIAGALATTFGSFNASGFGKVVVASQKTGAMREVTDVYVDHVLDTQRRRRDKIIDTAPNHATVAA